MSSQIALLYTIQNQSPHVGQVIPVYPPSFKNLYLVPLDPSSNGEKNSQMLLPHQTQVVEFNQFGFKGVIDLWVTQRPDLPLTDIHVTPKDATFKLINSNVQIHLQNNGVIRILGEADNNIRDAVFRTTWSVIYAQNRIKNRYTIRDQFRPR